MRRLLFCAAAAALVSGCAVKDPVRTRWAELSSPLVENVQPTLSISSIEAVSPPAKLRDLAEGTGAAYVEALAGKIADADSFRAAVASGIAPKRIADADETRLSRTVAISTGKTGYQAGQRFIATRVVIEPIGFAFADATQVTSKYATIDLETVSVESSTSAKISISPQLGNVIEAGEASFSRDDKIGSSYTNSARIEALSMDFRADRIEIYQQSGPNEDLTGIVLANVGVRPVALDRPAQLQLFKDLDVAPSEFEFGVDQTSPETVVADMKLADDKGKRLAPVKASLTTVVNNMWVQRPLYVCAAMSYITRIPTPETARFFDEGRQVVRELAGRLEGQTFLFVPAEEVSQPLWSIRVGKTTLKIDTPSGRSSFSFTDPVQASRFTAWLTSSRATSIGGKRLWMLGEKGKDVALAHGKGLVIEVQPNFSADAAPAPPARPCHIEM